jgi:translation initiation factor 1
MGHGPVHSKKHGRMCHDCSKPISRCVCRQKKEIAHGDGIVLVGTEKKGRKRKGVTVITGVPLVEPALKELGKQLKANCGAGARLKWA